VGGPLPSVPSTGTPVRGPLTSTLVTLNDQARLRNDRSMTHSTERTTRPAGEGRDELDDSWFDLPVITEAPRQTTMRPPRDPEAELDDSWFDRPGRGIRRSDVLDRA
jgi:hypothetical protein